jgi:pyridoxal phosphate enzyme (YggS family)
MDTFRDRLEQVMGRIKGAAEGAGRSPKSVSLLAVSKFHPIEALQEAMECGITSFAENYVQEAAQKSALLPGASFAMIGPLQRNKAKPALLCCTSIMTLDRPELASRLTKLAEEIDLKRDVWIQIDLWGEESKMGGCGPDGVRPILDALGTSSSLTLRGFMAIPPMGLSSAFGELAIFREEWQQRLGKKLLLSIGMSDDLEEAIKAGSDQVRVGTALFGSRG